MVSQATTRYVLFTLFIDLRRESGTAILSSLLSILCRKECVGGQLYMALPTLQQCIYIYI